LVILAASIHLSAIFSLALIPVITWGYNRHHLFIVLGLGLFFFVFGGVSNLGPLFFEYKLPFYSYFYSAIWADKQPGMFSQVVTTISILIACGVVFLYKSLDLDKRLVGIFILYVALRAFLSDMHAGHRVLMLFKPFLMLFIVHFIGKVLVSLQLKSNVIGNAAIAFVFSCYAIFNMSVRLSDDSKFYDLQLNLDFITPESEYILNVCCEK